MFTANFDPCAFVSSTSDFCKPSLSCIKLLWGNQSGVKPFKLGYAAYRTHCYIYILSLPVCAAFHCSTDVFTIFLESLLMTCLRKHWDYSFSLDRSPGLDHPTEENQDYSFFLGTVPAPANWRGIPYSIIIISRKTFTKYLLSLICYCCCCCCIRYCCWTILLSLGNKWLRSFTAVRETRPGHSFIFASLGNWHK